MGSSWRFVGGAVGFAFGVVWMSLGFGPAILSLLLSTLGYSAVFVAERSRADASMRREPSQAPRLENAASPVDEVEYGWPTTAGSAALESP